VWSGQWRLNAWPNFAITIGLMALTIVRRERDPPRRDIDPNPELLDRKP
jgi:hypothetical protein